MAFPVGILRADSWLQAPSPLPAFFAAMIPAAPRSIDFAHESIEN